MQGFNKSVIFTNVCSVIKYPGMIIYEQEFIMKCTEECISTFFTIYIKYFYMPL